LDGYKRPLVTSLSSNLQRFGTEKVSKVETLQEIIEEMSEEEGAQDRSRPTERGQRDAEALDENIR